MKSYYLSITVSCTANAIQLIFAMLSRFRLQYTIHTIQNFIRLFQKLYIAYSFSFDEIITCDMCFTISSSVYSSVFNANLSTRYGLYSRTSSTVTPCQIGRIIILFSLISLFKKLLNSYSDQPLFIKLCDKNTITNREFTIPIFI